VDQVLSRCSGSIYCSVKKNPFHHHARPDRGVCNSTPTEWILVSEPISEACHKAMHLAIE